MEVVRIYSNAPAASYSIFHELDCRIPENTRIELCDFIGNVPHDGNEEGLERTICITRDKIWAVPNHDLHDGDLYNVILNGSFAFNTPNVILNVLNDSRVRTIRCNDFFRGAESEKDKKGYIDTIRKACSDPTKVDNKFYSFLSDEDGYFLESFFIKPSETQVKEMTYSDCFIPIDYVEIIGGKPSTVRTVEEKDAEYRRYLGLMQTEYVISLIKVKEVSTFEKTHDIGTPTISGEELRSIIRSQLQEEKLDIKLAYEASNRYINYSGDYSETLDLLSSHTFDIPDGPTKDKADDQLKKVLSAKYC